MCFTNEGSKLSGKVLAAWQGALGLTNSRGKKNVQTDFLNSQMVIFFTRLQQFVSIKGPLSHSIMYKTEAES